MHHCKAEFALPVPTYLKLTKEWQCWVGIKENNCESIFFRENKDQGEVGPTPPYVRTCMCIGKWRLAILSFGLRDYQQTQTCMHAYVCKQIYRYITCTKYDVSL